MIRKMAGDEDKKLFGKCFDLAKKRAKLAESFLAKSRVFWQTQRARCHPTDLPDMSRERIRFVKRFANSSTFHRLETSGTAFLITNFLSLSTLNYFERHECFGQLGTYEVRQFLVLAPGKTFASLIGLILGNLRLSVRAPESSSEK